MLPDCDPKASRGFENTFLLATSVIFTPVRNLALGPVTLPPLQLLQIFLKFPPNLSPAQSAKVQTKRTSGPEQLPGAEPGGRVFKEPSPSDRFHFPVVSLR